MSERKKKIIFTHKKKTKPKTKFKLARGEDQRQKNARETIKKNNTGKNKGYSADTIRNAKDMVESATPWGMMSLITQINILADWPYALALAAAMLKDILDFSEATGIGYVIVIVFTFLCSIWIAMMMLLANGSAGRRQQKNIRSWLILLSGTTMKLIFGIDILPIETITVLIIYTLFLIDKKQSAKDELAN